MGKATTVENAPKSLEQLMAEANENESWEVVTEESPTKVIFDTIGDLFIGDYAGAMTVPADQNISKDHPEGEAFDLYLFRGLDGKLYSFNKSTKLELAMEKVSVSQRCRLTYVGDVPTKRGQHPMKDITVDVAAPRQ